MKTKKINFKCILYLITDKNYVCNLESAVEQALRGGVNMVQYREKREVCEEERREILRLKDMCRRYGALFIINDNPQLALEVGADGVHLGSKDMSVYEARNLLGEEMIIGRSARDVEEAVHAESEGADYLGSGALYPTSTKKDIQKLSERQLSAICASVSIPVVAIGGINRGKLTFLKGSGISGVASSKGLLMQKNIEENAVKFMKELKKIIT